ncbi:transcriptional regulator [Rhizobium ruizarguesonis]|nr:transcriptional regulator [Rhizobium ruizarguesonis]TAW16155.1 transcriptional regulator [Rhizobium ruizarguesonis]TAZ51683.1 transcriptional regulator [Rhizobium ruizarguesonis]
MQRTLAELSQGDLAKAANVSVQNLKRTEGASGPMPDMTNNVAAVVRAFEAAGIEFIRIHRGNGIIELRGLA